MPYDKSDNLFACVLYVMLRNYISVYLLVSFGEYNPPPYTHFKFTGVYIAAAQPLAY